MERKHESALSTNLIKLRQNNRYSQREIAEFLGISQPSYSRIESGRTHIKAFHIGRLATFYGTEVNVLYQIIR